MTNVRTTLGPGAASDLHPLAVARGACAAIAGRERLDNRGAGAPDYATMRWPMRSPPPTRC